MTRLLNKAVLAARLAFGAAYLAVVIAQVSFRRWRAAHWRQKLLRAATVCVIDRAEEVAGRELSPDEAAAVATGFFEWLKEDRARWDDFLERPVRQMNLYLSHHVF